MELCRCRVVFLLVQCLHIGCDDGSVSTYDGTDVVQNVYSLDASSVMGLWTKYDYLYALAKVTLVETLMHAVDLSSGQAH